MEKRKQSYFRPDPRTWLLLCLLGIASILLVEQQPCAGVWPEIALLSFFN